MCESLLKDALYDMVKLNPQQAQTAIIQSRFKNSLQLSETLKKVDYLSKGIHGYHNSVCNYTRRFFHHVAQVYFENKHFGGNYTVMGATLLLVGGLQTAVSSDPNTDEQKKNEGWGTAAFGGVAMILYPIVQVVVSTIKDEP